MSFDLAVWFTDRRLSDDEAGRLYDRLCDGDTAGLVPSPVIASFHDALTAIHPAIDSVPKERLGDTDYSPWSNRFTRSSGHMLLSCVRPKADDVALLVLALAQKHGLAVFDPQLGIALHPDIVEFGAAPAGTQEAAGVSRALRSVRSTLTADGQAALVPASFAVVKRTLHMLGPRGPAFVVLGSSDESYVQTAGDRRRLTIEFRQQNVGSYAHYALGRAPLSEAFDRIEYRHGSIKVRTSEVLDLEDALRVFRCFYASGTVPQEYFRHDVTAEHF